ncbi:MAG: polysaccharide pyruvyl transferase family protein [Pseudomonadota bacterium]
MSTTQNTAANAPVVALFGHTGNENLGDEAITESVIANLKARLPGVTFKLFTIVPEDSRQRHGYDSFPLRPEDDASISNILYLNWQSVDDNSANAKAPLHERDGWTYTQVAWRPTLKQRLRRLFDLVTNLPAIVRNERRFEKRNIERMKDVDLMIFTGSNQFLDNFGGPWAFPFTLRRWARIARKSNTPIAFASLGAGPIYSPLSMKHFRKAVKQAAYVSVRDKPSKTLLQQAGCDVDIHVAPDLAFSLPERVNPRATDWQHPVVGINPMPVYSSNYWYVSDARLYNNFVDALAQTAVRLHERGFPFFFFATQTKDSNVMKDVFERLRENGHTQFDEDQLSRPSTTVAALQETMGSTDIIVATRFHGTVIGLHSKKLVMSTSYYRKAADLLEEFGLGDYAFQIEELQADELMANIDRIIQEREQRAPKINAMQAQYEQELAAQYDTLCQLIR